MSRQVKFIKDWNDHKKDEVTHVREKEFVEAVKAGAVSVDTSIDTTKVTHQSKESSDGNTKVLRTNKRKRR